MSTVCLSTTHPLEQLLASREEGHPATIQIFPGLVPPRGNPPLRFLYNYYYPLFFCNDRLHSTHYPPSVSLCQPCLSPRYSEIGLLLLLYSPCLGIPLGFENLFQAVSRPRKKEPTRATRTGQLNRMLRFSLRVRHCTCASGMLSGPPRGDKITTCLFNSSLSFIILSK